MIPLIVLYGAVVVFALIHWAWIRFILYKGLDNSFIKARQGRGFEHFFERHKITYLKNMIWSVLYFIVLGFAVCRLLSVLGLWSFETVFISSGIWLIWAKDRLHYFTALFVVKRKVE